MHRVESISIALERLGISSMAMAGGGAVVAELPADGRVADFPGSVAASSVMVKIEYSPTGDRVLVGWLDCLELADAAYPLEASQAMVAANRHLSMVRFELNQSDRQVSVVGVIPTGPTADLASALQMVLGDIQTAARRLMVAVEFAAATGIVLVEGSEGRVELELADLVHIAGGERGVLQLAGKRDPMAAVKQFTASASQGRRPSVGEMIDMAGGREVFIELLVEAGRIPRELLC